VLLEDFGITLLVPGLADQSTSLRAILSGWEAAVQSTAASAASFFVHFFTNGRTGSGAISFTSCPRPLAMRAE
jgi:hypothetical protein